MQSPGFRKRLLRGAERGRQRLNDVGGNRPAHGEGRPVHGERLEGAPPAHAAGRVHHDLPALAQELGHDSRAAGRERHVDHVRRRADVDALNLAGLGDDALAEEEARREILVGARRAHDHRKRLPFEPDLEGRLGCDPVASRAGTPLVEPHDVERLNAVAIDRK